MKKYIFILIILPFLGFSQSFNYQAAVRDGAGDLVTNQSIGVGLLIRDGGPSGTVLYAEEHAVTSNAYGVISLSVGSGTTADNFNAIDWATQSQWLEVSADITGGTNYILLGSSKLQHVPFAIHASTSSDKAFSTTANVTSNAPGNTATDDFVFGATANVTTGVADADRLIFDKSKGAFRAGRDIGGVNAFSDANTGFWSAAFGLNNFATGAYTTASGFNNRASGSASTSFGYQNTASGNNTIALGISTTAESFAQTSLGHYNTSVAGNATGIVTTDRLFVIGNGTAVTPSDAITILKNGNTTLNGSLTIDGDNQGSGTSYTLPAQDGTANQIMQTDGSGIVSWVNAATGAFSTTNNVTSNALGTIATDDFVFGSSQIENDTGTTNDDNRFFFDKGSGIFRAGRALNNEWNYANMGSYSVAFGSNNIAKGSSSSAFGTNNAVEAFNSFVSGENNTIGNLAINSSAFGTSNTITGLSAFTTGSSNTISATSGVAMGVNLHADSYNQITMGYNNTQVSGDLITPVLTDRLFVIGNGSSNTNRSDALTILKNGNTTLNGSLTIDGDNQGAGTAYTLPTQDGTANQIMQTNGSGAVSWVNAPTMGAFSTTGNVTSNAPGNTTTDDFVFGSTQLASVGGSNDDKRFFFDKSKGAFRAGQSTGTQWDDVSVGFHSTALGENNIASGNNSFATGFSNNVSGYAATVLGNDNTVLGNYATASGTSLTSESFSQFTLGQWNTAHPGTPDASGWISTDRLLVVGNGANGSSNSDALVMLKNGNTTLNGSLTIDGDNQGTGTSYTLPTQDGTTNQIMQTDGSGTVSWVNAPSNGAFSTTANVTSNTPGTIATDDFVFGSMQLADDTNSIDDNRRMFFDKSKGAFRAGATNDSSRWDDANIGFYSAAFGFENIASGPQTFTSGGFNQVNRFYGAAIGNNNLVDGQNAAAIGSFLNSESYAQITLGSFNTGATGNPTTYVANDRLLVIGNGASNGARSDALTILKNGNTTLNGSLTIDGDNAGSGTSYTLPAQDGTANQIMQTDGSGTVSWIDTNQAVANLNNTSVTTTALTVTNLPSFAADLTNTVTASAANTWVEATGWTSNDAIGRTQLHDIGNHFNETTGRFVAPVNGLYQFNCQVRIDSVESGFVRVVLALNGTPDLNSAFHVINIGASDTLFQSLTLGGVMKLNQNDEVSIFAITSLDTDWSIQSESGFTGYLINRL